MITLTLDGEGKNRTVKCESKSKTYLVYRRICPAISLAETEIFATFVQIFSRCFVEPTSDGLPDIESAVNSGLTTAPVRYKVKFIKRTSSLTVGPPSNGTLF